MLFRSPAPVRQHRKRGLAPTHTPSPALAEARRKLDECLQATHSALRIERLRAMADGPDAAGDALREVAEMWKTAYADR